MAIPGGKQIREIVAEAAGRGVDEAGIGMAVGRPLSSLAKLIDEYLYTAITRGWHPDGPAGSAAGKTTSTWAE